MNSRESQAFRNAMALVPEGRKLKTLDCLLAERSYSTRERRIARQRFLESIRNLAEDGEIAVVWSGMDCDCVSYSNSVRIVGATKREVEAHIEETYAWADGPCSYYLEKPSTARDLRYRSRDLALEAHENGHRHHIVMGEA